MIQVIHFLLTLVTTSVRSRLSLQAENAALRNQLLLYRKSGQRPAVVDSFLDGFEDFVSIATRYSAAA